MLRKDLQLLTEMSQQLSEQWRHVVERKAYRGRIYEVCGDTSSKKEIKRRSSENGLKKKNKQEGMQGQWQVESPAKEY